MMAKMKKYKEEISRLKQRVKTQNLDIEDALKLLTVNFQIRNRYF